MRRLLTIVCVLFASVLAGQENKKAEPQKTAAAAQISTNQAFPLGKGNTNAPSRTKLITEDQSVSINERTRNLTILAGLCIGLGVFYAVYLDYWSKWALWLRLAAVLGLMVLVESVILILFN